MTAPALIFLAPPSTGADPDDAAGTPSWDPRPAAPAGGRAKNRPGALRMTRGAREAAAGLKVSDADIQRCLDAPDDVTPDERTPSRTRFRLGTLVVLAAADGMVLRVQRRGRPGTTARPRSRKG